MRILYLGPIAFSCVKQYRNAFICVAYRDGLQNLTSFYAVVSSLSDDTIKVFCENESFLSFWCYFELPACCAGSVRACSSTCCVSFRQSGCWSSTSWRSASCTKNAQKTAQQQWSDANLLCILYFVFYFDQIDGTGRQYWQPATAIAQFWPC